MIRHGEPPYLEASSAGNKSFSALFARIVGRNFRTIEDIYQCSKVFEDGSSVMHWKDAKGRRAVNQEELAVLYTQLWREYLLENSHLIPILVSASGISDKFGQIGHQCQASSLWSLRQEYIDKGFL